MPIEENLLTDNDFSLLALLFHLFDVQLSGLLAIIAVGTALSVVFWAGIRTRSSLSARAEGNLALALSMMGGAPICFQHHLYGLTTMFL